MQKKLGLLDIRQTSLYLVDPEGHDPTTFGL